MNDYMFVAVFLAAFLVVSLSLALWNQWRGSVPVHEMSTLDIQHELQRLMQKMTEGHIRGVPVKSWVVERIGDLEAEQFRRGAAAYRSKLIRIAPTPTPLVPTEEQIHQLAELLRQADIPESKRAFDRLAPEHQERYVRMAKAAVDAIKRVAGVAPSFSPSS